MRNFIVLFYLLLAFISNNTFAQNCGTDELHNTLMSEDADYKKTFKQLQNSVYQYQNKQQPNQKRQLFTVPLVVHVLHLGEPLGTGSNISDQDIYDAIQGLNDRFANVIGNGLDIELEFCLATRDPNGCPTSGINRVDASFIQEYVDYGIGNYCDSAAPAATMKDLSKWPVSDYYNIWVVHRIPRDNCTQVWGGYAFYPNGGPYDGAVMRSASMNYNSTTLSHELGHGFNLFHTFNGDGGNQSCPDNTDCLMDGDRVCDTPPHKQTDCGASNPCTANGIWDNSVENYMSYCSPSQSQGRFTQGQKDRIVATFQSFPRNNLLNSIGCGIPEIDIQFTKTEATCDSICDAVLTVNTACPLNYSYLWNTGDTTATIDFLCTGNYSVTITDLVSGFVDSASTSVNVKPLPNDLYFNIPENNKVVCSDIEMVYLRNYVNPDGGIFSGNGINSNGNFYPQIAGTGAHIIVYKYPNVSIDECAVFLTDTIYVDECIGVETNSKAIKIKLTPNPVRNVLYLDFTLDIFINQIAIFDVSGKQVKVFDVQDVKNKKVYVEDLSQGVYFLRVNSNETYVTKFLKID